MNADELAVILVRIEEGITTLEDAQQLREFIAYILDVAIARGESLGFIEADNDWRKIFDRIEEF